jgi:hypothetical protein
MLNTDQLEKHSSPSTIAGELHECKTPRQRSGLFGGGWEWEGLVLSFFKRVRCGNTRALEVGLGGEKRVRRLGEPVAHSRSLR